MHRWSRNERVLHAGIRMLDRLTTPPSRCNVAATRPRVARCAMSPRECPQTTAWLPVGRANAAIKRMNALDQRLYAWLTEPDEPRFERAFNGYFSVAFPAVVRYLARLSHW